MNALTTFCRQIRARSAEHRAAMQILSPHRLLGQMTSILRQELDSMVRVIYLLAIKDHAYRETLIEASVNGKQWAAKGKNSRITDKEMTELASQLHGWTASVYKFGCAFIHLSAFHDYSDRDPLHSLPYHEQTELLDHLRHYHSGPVESHPTFNDLAPYLPRVLEKVSSNLEHYLQQLEGGKEIDFP